MTAEAVAGADAPAERTRDNQAWARWLARSADALLLTPFNLVFFFGLGVAIEMGRAPAAILDWLEQPILAAIIHLCAMLVLFALWEPLFISNTGTTPGKWIMGIRVVRASGERLSFPRALTRFLQVWFVGAGAGIPLLSLITMLMARAKLINDGATGWDENLGLRVEHRQRHPLLWGVVVVVVIGINLAARVLERMPSAGSY